MQVIDNRDTLELRPGRQRGAFVNSWLDARFSFSFGSYQQAGRDGFGLLRALNEDRVQPGTGFAMHPHRDLDIFILPLVGVVEHRDSLGHHAFVRPGQVQRMQAGRGIRHSQMNASASEPDHHLQIWLKPAQMGGTSSVETRHFDLFGHAGQWCTVISPDGQDGSFAIHQAGRMATTRVLPERPATWQPVERSLLYLHVIDGSVQVAADEDRVIPLAAGDALAIDRAGVRPLRIDSGATARLVIFEFAHAGRA